jgi:hypothetical protein
VELECRGGLSISVGKDVLERTSYFKAMMTSSFADSGRGRYKVEFEEPVVGYVVGVLRGRGDRKILPELMVDVLGKGEACFDANFEGAVYGVLDFCEFLGVEDGVWTEVEGDLLFLLRIHVEEDAGEALAVFTRIALNGGMKRLLVHVLYFTKKLRGGKEEEGLFDSTLLY